MSKELLFSFSASKEVQTFIQQALKGRSPAWIPDAIELAETVLELKESNALGSILQEMASTATKLKI